MPNELLNIQSFSIFRISNHYFAVEADKVIEIMTVPPVTQVPNGADYMKGLFNHRGRILSLIDSSVRLSLDPIEISEHTPLMVIYYDDSVKVLEFGILVDEVIEVKEVEKVEESSSLETTYNESFVRGVVRYKDLHVTLLDIKNTFEIK